MPSRGAWGNSRERTKFKRRSPTLSLVQVSPTFLQVCILGTRCWEGDICLKHMHTLRLSAGEKKATCHCDCWFRSSYITNPLLILFGGEGGKCDATKTGARMSLPGQTQPVRKQRERKTEKYRLLWNVSRLWSCQKYHIWKCLLLSSNGFCPFLF